MLESQSNTVNAASHQTLTTVTDRPTTRAKVTREERTLQNLFLPAASGWYSDKCEQIIHHINYLQQ